MDFRAKIITNLLWENKQTNKQTNPTVAALYRIPTKMFLSLSLFFIYLFKNSYLFIFLA